MTANFLQGLFAQQIGIAFTGCCEIDDLVGYGLFDVIVAVSNPQGDADHFECDTQDVLGLGIEFVAVKEWRDGRGALPISGGSPTRRREALGSVTAYGWEWIRSLTSWTNL